jgi:hypothetical protein
MSNLTQSEELADYRRSVAELYLIARNHYMELEDRLMKFLQGRNRLFATHPQSPLSPEQKQTFTGLNYFDYNPHYRLLVLVDPDVEPGTLEMELPEEGIIPRWVCPLSPPENWLPAPIRAGELDFTG